MSYEQMVDMAVTPSEHADILPSVAPEPTSQPIYPYNLSISLQDEELEKLGIDCDDEDCQVGNYLHLHALAEVTSYSKNKTNDGERRCLGLQITHLEVEDESAENDEADEEMSEGHVYRKAGPY